MVYIYIGSMLEQFFKKKKFTQSFAYKQTRYSDWNEVNSSYSQYVSNSMLVSLTSYMGPFSINTKGKLKKVKVWTFNPRDYIRLSEGPIQTCSLLEQQNSCGGVLLNEPRNKQTNTHTQFIYSIAFFERASLYSLSIYYPYYIILTKV